MIVLTDQMLVYKDSQVIPRLIVPRTENVDKMPKCILIMSAGMFSDLRITILRFFPEFLK